MGDFASVTLRRAADPDDAFVLRRLQGWDGSSSQDGTFLHFEGREWPTGARSTTKSRTRRVSVLFARNEHGLAADLIDFLERASDDADARLLVEPDVGFDSRLAAPWLAEVHTWSDTSQTAGRIEVAFELTRVG